MNIYTEINSLENQKSSFLGRMIKEGCLFDVLILFSMPINVYGKVLMPMFY